MSVRKRYAPTYKELQRRTASRGDAPSSSQNGGDGRDNGTCSRHVWEASSSVQRGDYLEVAYNCVNCTATETRKRRL